MIKKYVTWTGFYADNRFIVHPTFEIKELWNGVISFKETSYGNTETDKRYLGIIEYDDNLKQEVLDRFIFNFSKNAMFIITPEKALELCNEWYGNYFELNKDGFTLIDNRPEEEI